MLECTHLGEFPVFAGTLPTQPETVSVKAAAQLYTTRCRHWYRCKFEIILHVHLIWGMAFSGLVLGHASVYDMAEDMAAPSLSPQHCASHLRISHYYDSVHILASRRAKVNDIMDLFQRSSSHPDCVVLDIGSNDLVDGVPPLQATTDIVYTARQLVKYHGVRLVIVCSMLYRRRDLGALNFCQYKDAVDKTNTYLRRFCSQNDTVCYHTHKGFWNVPTYQNGSLTSYTPIPLLDGPSTRSPSGEPFSS